jgi:hypothetical protein
MFVLDGGSGIRKWCVIVPFVSSKLSLSNRSDPLGVRSWIHPAQDTRQVSQKKRTKQKKNKKKRTVHFGQRLFVVGNDQIASRKALAPPLIPVGERYSFPFLRRSSHLTPDCAQYAETNTQSVLLLLWRPPSVHIGRIRTQQSVGHSSITLFPDQTQSIGHSSVFQQRTNRWINRYSRVGLHQPCGEPHSGFGIVCRDCQCLENLFSEFGFELWYRQFIGLRSGGPPHPHQIKSTICTCCTILVSLSLLTSAFTTNTYQLVSRENARTYLTPHTSTQRPDRRSFRSLCSCSLV